MTAFSKKNQKPAFHEIKQYYKPGLCTRLLGHQKDEKKDAVKSKEIYCQVRKIE